MRLVGGEVVDGGDIAVGADAHVVLAADIHGMLDVGDDVRGGGVSRRAQERHEVDPDEPALVGHTAELGVGLVARQIAERPAARVVDRDRPARDGDGVQAGALARVGEVDHDPAGVQPRHHLAPEGRQATVLRRHGAVADLVGGIIGQLDDPDAAPLEHVDPVQVRPHLGGVLEAVNHPDPAGVTGAQDVGGGGHAEEVLRPHADDAVPGVEGLQRVVVGIVGAGDVAQGDVHRREPGGMGVTDGAIVDVGIAGVGRRALGATEREVGVLDTA